MNDADTPAYDGLEVDRASAVADGPAWGLRLTQDVATGGEAIVELPRGEVMLSVAVEDGSTRASSGVFLDADEAEAVARTLLDAAEAARDSGGGR